MSTEKCIALALLTGGRDKLTSEEIARYAEIIEVTTRTIYRYLDKIGRAKFLIAKMKH